MKRGAFLSRSIFVLAGAAALGSNAHGDTIVRNTVFSEIIVIETDTFETPGGTEIFATGGVGYSDWLSPIIASDLAGDSTVPSQIQSTASLVTLATENLFLAGPGPQYLVLGGSGPAIADPFADQDIGLDLGYALAAAGGAAYSEVGSPTASTVGQWSFSTTALEPDGSILEGTVNFDVVAESIVEQPVTVAPEPSMLAPVGLAMLLLLARRKAAGGLK